MQQWDPFRDMELLRREIDRAFANVMATPSRPNRAAVAFLPGRAARAYPLVNIQEDGENLYIEALAPGLDPETLNLNIVRNNLTLSGEKPAPKDIPVEAYHRNERAAGKFVRNLTLPVAVDSSGATAQYSEGILRITLPKAEEAKPRQINVALN